jgi:hypothetical protein
MLQVIRAKYIKDYIVWVSLSDGSKGNVDLAAFLKEDLQDKAIFTKLRLDPKLSTITWPNGTSFTPEFLKANIARANLG